MSSQDFKNWLFSFCNLVHLPMPHPHLSPLIFCSSASTLSFLCHQSHSCSSTPVFSNIFYHPSHTFLPLLLHILLAKVHSDICTNKARSIHSTAVPSCLPHQYSPHTASRTTSKVKLCWCFVNVKPPLLISVSPAPGQPSTTACRELRKALQTWLFFTSLNKPTGTSTTRQMYQFFSSAVSLLWTLL